MPYSKRGPLANTSEHLVSLNLEKSRVPFFVEKLDPDLSKILCVHLHNALRSPYSLYPTTPDRCLTAVGAILADSDGQCHLPPSLFYPAKKELLISPFAALYKHSPGSSACHPVVSAKILLTACFPHDFNIPSCPLEGVLFATS